ncbi:LysE family translocator [Marinobacteraceae bacterium S3BR75-40.1]
MSFSAWLSVALLCSLGAMSPGPSLAIVLRYTVQGSRGQGMATALAHGLGIGLYAFGVLVGLGALFKAWPAVEMVLSLAGALYLGWLGLKAIAAATPGAFNGDRGDNVAATRHPVRDGFMVAFLNPKVAVFFIALFAPFVGQAGAGAYPLLLAATAWVIDTGWYLLVALVLSSSAILPWLQRHSHWVDRVSGLVLLAVAGGVVWQVL